MSRALPAIALLAACASDPDSGAASGSSTSSTSRPTTTTTETDPPTPTSTSIATSDTSTSIATSDTSTTVTTSTSTTTADPSETTTGEPPDSLRYDDVRQKSAHNSFQRHEALLDQLVYHRVRSLELDIHHSAALAPELPGDWYVYHIDVVDDDSHCRTLSACLGQIAALGRAVPEHEVVTVWVDLKDPFIAAHQPADLDARLQAAFGGRLLRPAELLAACPAATTLQDAVTLPGCGWPALTDLRGRVLVALTGGDLEDPQGALASYVGADPTLRAAFVAPGLAAADLLHAHPAAVFFNLEVGDLALATAVRAAGLVSRVWVVDDADAWAAAEQAGAHHIATNKVNTDVDPWSSSVGAGGWPFRCLDACDPPDAEPGAVLTAEVESGDLWGTSDDAIFAHTPIVGAVAVTALVAVPSSHVEPWAKACVAARQGPGPAAPYLAVCRAADDHRLRVQVRDGPGGDTEAIDLGDLPDLDAESPAFARLELDPAALCARGLGSADGEAWTLIAEHCFAAPLTDLGVTASSHAGGQLRLLFADLRVAPDGPLAADDLVVAPLGPAAGGVHDGL